ncbi:MAG: hypothetical protein ACI8VW_002909, partial [bacterium]
MRGNLKQVLYRLRRQANEVNNCMDLSTNRDQAFGLIWKYQLTKKSTDR